MRAQADITECLVGINSTLYHKLSSSSHSASTMTTLSGWTSTVGNLNTIQLANNKITVEEVYSNPIELQEPEGILPFDKFDHFG